MRMTSVIVAAALVAFAAPAIAQDTPTEEERMAAFKSNDKDGDGKLNKEEYKALLDQLGFGEMADQLFSLRDANGDGFITEEEYAMPLQ